MRIASIFDFSFSSTVFLFFGVDMVNRNGFLGLVVFSHFAPALHHLVTSTQICLGTLSGAERFGSALYSFQAYVQVMFLCHARYPPYDVTPPTTALHDKTKARLSSDGGIIGRKGCIFAECSGEGRGVAARALRWWLPGGVHAAVL